MRFPRAIRKSWLRSYYVACEIKDKPEFIFYCAKNVHYVIKKIACVKYFVGYFLIINKLNIERLYLSF